jgi:RND family efflux transporter MFP subunit
MKKKINLTVTLLLSVILSSMVISLPSCTKEKKIPPKSMEQIRNEEGVPVKIQEIVAKKFEKFLSFYCKLSGIQESTTHSLVADKIAKVRFKLGDGVKEKQIVVEFPLDNPAVQYSQAKAAFENSEKMYRRMKELLASGETSQLNYDNIETQYLVNKRNWESVKQMLFVEAPISGTISELFVKEGDDIDRGKPIFTVAQLNRMKAKIWVSETEVTYLKTGMNATLIYNDTPFEGKISEIGLVMDPYTKAFGVEIQFNNPKRILRSGVTSEIRIRTYLNPSAVIIPRNLIMKEGNQSFVYLVKGSTAEKRLIETGLESGIDVEIKNGLQPGDIIVIEGSSLLQNGSKILVK